MKKEELLKELEKVFTETKKELGFQANMEDLDRAFFIKDAVLRDGFVSEKFSKQLCYRIVEIFMGWNDYLHSIIMPNPQNILNMSESKIFSQGEKREIVELMKKIMEMSSRSSLANLQEDKKTKAEFIDGALLFWNKEFKPKIITIMKKINKEWGILK